MALLQNAGRAILTNRIKGSGTEPAYVAIGTGSTAEAASQTALVTEVETRTLGTSTQQTTSVTNDTYQVVGTVTATTTRTLAECGLFDASSTGNMFIRSLLSPTVGLNNGDSIQLTIKLQFS